MDQNSWIHSFTVNEISTHKKGYTIYKITSIVFPRNTPEALTCISVWKRFHDIKRLYRELQKRHKIANLRGNVPEPKGDGFFKRFKPEVIENRKQYIIQLLDFAAQDSVLYKSIIFIKFFDNGHTPPNQSPIHVKSNKRNSSIKRHSELLKNELSIKHAEHCERNNSKISSNVHDKEMVITVDNEKINERENCNKVVTKKKELSKMLLTPMVSIESDDNDYIYEAALEFSHAVQAEVNLDFYEAHKLYKSGVEILLNGSKNETNTDRKFIAKAKVGKYMARADAIYENYILHSETQKQLSFQLSLDLTDSEPSSPLYLERPWNQLSRFKVIKIIHNTVLQVQDVTDKMIYVMKGIEKPACKSLPQSMFLPQNVPYMVKLIAFFQSDEKIFLLLQQAKGGKLLNYINNYEKTTKSFTSLNEIFADIDIKLKPQKDDEKINLVSSEEIHPTNNLNGNDLNKINYKGDNISEEMDINELVTVSQKLLQSVSRTLEKSKEFICKNDEDDNVIQENEIFETKEHINSEGLNKNTQPEALLSDNSTLILKDNVPEVSIKKWAKELIVAIESLHSKGVILGDLHLDNLLLGSNGQLLLTYFYQLEGDNLFNNLPFDIRHSHSMCVAPETPLTIKSDWWSLGIILFELLTGCSYRACHQRGPFHYFELQFPIDKEISESARDLLQGLLRIDTSLRLDLDGIKCHRFFENTSWDEISQIGVNSY